MSATTSQSPQQELRTQDGQHAPKVKELLLGTLTGCGRHRVTLPEVKPPSQVFEPLQEELQKSYLTLFETASKLDYSDGQILKMQEYLKQAQDYCVGKFEGVSGEYERRVADA